PFLARRAEGKNTPIKAFLLNQAMMPGMGNIYACEILHLAGVAPSRPVCSLVSSEWERIIEATPRILQQAISCRGTTVSDWRDLFGNKGEFQGQLLVYSRDGLLCHRCRGKVQRVKLAGRGTYFCPGCQL
ncbi:MAG: zinc finger domain-containing protein, partial [Smithellaceae bacterium]|nr:zinc finger domain-containing protein [Smithellaceae bacterium]